MLNKVQFIGHLGRDPEVRYTADGAAVCNFSIASTERWKDKGSGEKKERTEWLRCSAFDRLAEICGEYLATGSLVYVEGQLQTRKYEKDGVDRYVTECRVQSMKMLGERPEREEEQQPQQPQRRSAPSESQRPAQRQQKPAGKTSTGFDDMDDDIPF